MAKHFFCDQIKMSPLVSQFATLLRVWGHYVIKALDSFDRKADYADFFLLKPMQIKYSLLMNDFDE